MPNKNLKAVHVACPGYLAVNRIAAARTSGAMDKESLLRWIAQHG